MRVTIKAPSAGSLNVQGTQLADAMVEHATHPGIAQFRVGSVTVGVLDTAVAVTFDAPFSDSDYQVFLQTDTNVNVVVYPSGLTPDGFTLNLSVGVIGTFAYLAIGVP